MSETPAIDDVILYCTFYSSGRLFGVPVLDVREVTTETRCTLVPHAPAEVSGLVNIRGHIVLALNLAALLGQSHHETPDDAQLVIFKPGVGASFGIIVDQVGDIVSVSSEDTEATSHQEQVTVDFTDRATFVSRICRLDDQLLIVLDPRRFLNCIEQTLHH